jgi:hypothetical protein
MDYNASNIMGVTGFALTLVGGIYTAINHKRLRSNCCGKDLNISVDVENTTPPTKLTAPPPIQSHNDS